MNSDGDKAPPHRAVVHERDPLIASIFADHLSETLELTVLGTTLTVDETLELVADHEPDVVLSHVGTPPDDRSMRLAQELRSRGSDTELIVFGSHGNPTTPEEYVKAGASRCLLADDTLDELKSALDEVIREL